MRCVLGRPAGQTGRAGARKEIAAEEQAHKECLVAEEERWRGGRGRSFPTVPTIEHARAPHCHMKTQVRWLARRATGRTVNTQVVQPAANRQAACTGMGSLLAADWPRPQVCTLGCKFPTSVGMCLVIDVSTLSFPHSVARQSAYLHFQRVPTTLPWIYLAIFWRKSFLSGN